ncbi:MAG: efflux RND transporter periplasmic adaptor subunit [Chloroflexales bacterium]|nr:efflux RND transporter periplasmic adaptor subunit [Chloroflexales bacterium]
MASTATPRKRNRNGRRLALIIGGVVLALAALAAAAFALAPRGPAPGSLPEGWQTVEATSGSIAATVSATGNVEPQAEAELRFESDGTVAAILVEPGDTAKQGQPLARIDTAGLQLQVEQAEADLRQAQADLEALLTGATAQEIAEAKARVEQARSQYTQTASTVSPADIEAARADLAAAKSRLARLEAGPASDELASATEQVQSAQSNLDNARVSLSAAKEQARVDLETRANALRNAQDEYSRIYWENRELEKLPGDLSQERKDQEAQAQRAVDDAEAALRTAQTAYDQAKQEEINTLAAREAELKSAIEARAKVVGGAKAEDLADARAAVERAQAKLGQLTGAQHQSELAAQASNIKIAQAGLDKLLADPTASDLTTRQASVARAEVSLKLAQRSLALGTLTAPFAATVARVDMRVGEPADATAIIALVDLSSFHVDLPVDELDIAQVKEGQRVNVDLDAIPGQTFGGTVTNVAPLATRSDTGTTTYEVTVTIDQESVGVRPGMTAVIEIITEEKQGVVLVPRRAVRAEGGQSFVLVPSPTQQPQPTAPGQTAALPGERRAVTIGLSNSEFVEIVSGLSAGDKVLVQDVVSTFNPSGPPR